jgi:hypothetical protein
VTTVALGQGGEQQLLRVPAVGVAVERAVGGALDVVLLAGRGDGRVAAVAAVRRRADASVACPGEVDCVVVVEHGILLVGASIHSPS